MTPDQQFIRVVNWERFQHYKHRNPPWIKLYCEMLSSRTWVSGSDADRVLAFAILMLAARHDNKIPLDPAYIRRVAYLNTEPNFAGLVASGFVQIIGDASNVLATCMHDASNLHQNALPETEKRQSREETEKKKNKTPRARRVSLPEGFAISDQVKAWAAEKGFDRLEERLEHFVGYAKANAKTYGDWDQAFRNAIRDDWAKLKQKGNGNGANRAEQRQASNLAALAAVKRDFGLVS